MLKIFCLEKFKRRPSKYVEKLKQMTASQFPSKWLQKLEEKKKDDKEVG
jgi:hypothetical protein